MIQGKKIIDEEIVWDKSQTIVSKTDTKGNILYVNDVFEKTSEYNKIELVGESHNVVRHPDMPKVVFKKLWESLQAGENYHAIVKNLTRTGRYYWVIADFVIEKDKYGDAVGFTGRRRSISRAVISKIEPFYETLLELEKLKGESASELYFDSYLTEEENKNYDEFVYDLCVDDKARVSKKAKVTANRMLKNFFFSTYM